jgi:hypothetical protein
MPKPSNWLDWAAVGLSALCLVHCLALPFVVAFLPLLAQFSEGHLHAQMLVVVLPLSILALGLGFRRHRSTRIVLAGTLGMITLVIGATVAHSELGLLADRAFTVVGALTLAGAHYFNTVRSRHACT